MAKRLRIRIKYVHMIKWRIHERVSSIGTVPNVSGRSRPLACHLVLVGGIRVTRWTA